MNILAECTKRRAVGGLSNLIHFLETVCVFYFILTLYFRTLFFYTTAFNPRINIDIIIWLATINGLNKLINGINKWY